MQISNDSATSVLAYQQNQPAETTPQMASINTLQNATISLSQAAKVSGGAEPMRGGGVIITGAEPMRGGGVIITGAEPMRGGGVIIT
ncbi:hypothetical protein CJF42_22890 [Pseudoalteromonas sp. NBT06-2]|uniref:hypothetical protein n=1 Tax=Pseudoalteromonas sp. NBT06-2 TaxID=2025950 RepID=UPI000BA6B146|nr:hypothetical protein [Pseudoalteromonas sp. NBT06-2]PAJ72121.1 hypothetical protein CJF42_22890 [Pseudoalteromonas sp. NBT06-2]